MAYDIDVADNLSVTEYSNTNTLEYYGVKNWDAPISRFGVGTGWLRDYYTELPGTEDYLLTEIAANIVSLIPGTKIRLSLYNSSGNFICQGTTAITASTNPSWQGHLTVNDIEPFYTILKGGNTYYISLSIDTFGGVAGRYYYVWYTLPYEFANDNYNIYTESDFPSTKPDNSSLEGWSGVIALRIGVEKLSPYNILVADKASVSDIKDFLLNPYFLSVYDHLIANEYLDINSGAIPVHDLIALRDIAQVLITKYHINVSDIASLSDSQIVTFIQDENLSVSDVLGLIDSVTMHIHLQSKKMLASFLAKEPDGTFTFKRNFN
jgi:hypothetical protein